MRQSLYSLYSGYNYDLESFKYENFLISWFRIYLLWLLPFKNDLLKKFIEVQLFEPELWLKYKTITQRPYDILYSSYPKNIFRVAWNAIQDGHEVVVAEKWCWTISFYKCMIHLVCSTGFLSIHPLGQQYRQLSTFLLFLYEFLPSVPDH